MLPTGRLKSRKSTLGTRSYLGIEPVRLLLPAASVKSKLGRSRRKNDLQKQTPLLHSASLQNGVHNAKKCLFRVNKENQEQSETMNHDSYEDISGIDEMVSSDSFHKNSYYVNERDTSKKASSVLTLRQDFLYNVNNVNLINRKEHKPIHSSVYMNSDKHHDEGQLLPLPSFLFPLNTFCSVSEDKVLNKIIDINLQSKLTPQLIDDTANLIPDIKSIQTNDESKKCINICEKTADCTPHYDTNLPNHLIVNKTYTDKCIEEMNSNENETQPKLSESQTMCTGKQEVNSKEKINNDSTLSFTFDEFRCMSNGSEATTNIKLALCGENIRSKSETDSITKCICEQMCICNTASLSKTQLPNKQKQTTQPTKEKELLIPEGYCMNTVKHVEAMVTVIENTQTCIQSIEKNIVEQLRNSVRQLDIIKYDLTNSLQKNNKCSCECLRNKILNVPSNLNHNKSDIKKNLLEDELQAKNCSISKSVGAENSKNSQESFNEFDESGSSQLEYKCGEEGINHINHHVLSTTVSYNTPEITMQGSTSGKKAFRAKNVTFKILHHTPVSSRKKTKVYSNYKSHYNMCVKTPESSVKLKRQMNKSLVLTPHSMSNRLSTQIGNLFQS